MKVETVESYRLSPQQKRLWLLSQAGRSQEYRAHCVVTVEGKIDSSLLRAAVETLAERFEILRTTFRRRAGMSIPVQVIGDARVDWGPDHDLSGLSAPAQQAGIEALISEAGESELDLERGPLFRVSLAPLAPDAAALIVSLPALYADTATLKNLLAALGKCYEAQLAERSLDDEPIQYADAAEWLNELLESEDTEAGRVFWSKHDLSGISAMTLSFELEVDEQAPLDSKFVAFQIKTELAARIEDLSRGLGVMPSTFLTAAWQVLLWRLTGQDKIIIGLGCEGRSYEGLSEAVGLFAKYLPLTADLEPGLRFDDLLRQEQQSASEIREWQEYFSWEAASPASIKQQYFPFIFDYEIAPARCVVNGVSFSMLQPHACIDRYKLRLICIKAGDGLAVELHYDNNLYTTADVDRMAGQFQKLLESAAADPSKPIGTLGFLTGEERRHILLDLNNTRTDYAGPTAFHRRFEEQAERIPDSVAVFCGDGHLSYRDLNTRANRLAHYLRANGAGAGAGTVVGVFMDRSLELVISILAVLKAGAAYMPLDPAYPKERITFMLLGANVPLLLTRQHLIGEVPENTSQIIDVDLERPAFADQSTQNPSGPNSLLSPAYLIYTSGSTGEPRGVIITQANLGHYVRAMAAKLEIVKSDRYLHTASISFSSSMRQLAVPLASGAAVVMATSEQRLDPVALFELIKQQGVTLVDLVPSHWRNCLQALRHIHPKDRATLLDNDLRLALSASEGLTFDVPETWKQEFGCEADFINMLGQTETTGIVAVYPIPARSGTKTKVVPVGRPIADTRIYLVNDEVELVPIGATGEIYIGGEGVGDGYLNRPDLTADRFIPDLFGDTPGARLYRTGDLARYHADGNIELLGRSDQQVKVRGFRVELGEIEAALASHQGIHEAVVLALDDADEYKRLTAYIVPRQNPAPSKEGLQSFLGERLPGYMVPSSYVILESLPLAPNGKLNRRALIDLEVASRADEAVCLEPRTPVEEMLVDIWRGVLGIERVGVNQNFFKLGGHSLLATVLISRVRDAFRMELPVLVLFECPTVAQFAQAIEEQLIKELDTQELQHLMRKVESLSDEEAAALGDR